jgi:hypothetical protein
MTSHENEDSFSGRNVELHRITLVPPQGRAETCTPILYQLLSNVWVLSSHFLGRIT